MAEALAWKEELGRALRDPRSLARLTGKDPEEMEAVSRLYPLLVPPYYLELCQRYGEPLWRQVAPTAGELSAGGPADHLGEQASSPARALLRRFRDRAVLFATRACAVACRFCNRKALLSSMPPLSREDLEEAIDYLASHREIRDVLVSGGDPLVLEDELLSHLLSRLGEMPHVEIIRVGSRVPVVLPSRVTESLARLLAQSPRTTYLVVHVNHPAELSSQAVASALERLARAGVPLLSQTVLLRGVNDEPRVLEELYWQMASRRIQPYYLFHAEAAAGTAPFQMPLSRGKAVVKEAFGRLPPELRPAYVLDTPGGKKALLDGLGPRSVDLARCGW